MSTSPPLSSAAPCKVQAGLQGLFLAEINRGRDDKRMPQPHPGLPSLTPPHPSAALFMGFPPPKPLHARAATWVGALAPASDSQGEEPAFLNLYSG